MICPNCRRETPDGMAFCFNCGAKLAAPSQVQQAQQQAQAAQQQAQQQAQAAQQQAQEAQRQAQEQARLAAERAQREAAERAQREAAERAQREAAERAQREAAERAQREAAERAQREAAEAQAKAQREAQAAQQKAQQQAQQAAQNPYPYGPQFNPQPQQYGPQGPQQYGPQGPQQYGPQGPQQYGPQGPQQYGPQGPQQFAPQPPKQPSGFEKLLKGEPPLLKDFYTKKYNTFLAVGSLISIAFVGVVFALFAGVFNVEGSVAYTLSILFTAAAALGASVVAQIMLSAKKFLGWILSFVAGGLRVATILVTMIGLFHLGDGEIESLTFFNCFYSIVALLVQCALVAFAVLVFIKNKEEYK